MRFVYAVMIELDGWDKPVGFEVIQLGHYEDEISAREGNYKGPVIKEWIYSDDWSEAIAAAKKKRTEIIETLEQMTSTDQRRWIKENTYPEDED